MTSYHFVVKDHQEQLLALLHAIAAVSEWRPETLSKLMNKHPRTDGRLFTKEQVLTGYRELAGSFGLLPQKKQILERLRMKPVRTQSGVTPITVLTKPFPCPGQCIFCPNDIRMPKSYLSDEPGAQRAERNYFDPYLQTYNRLQALTNIGHLVDKVEIIILGGTWSYYPEAYQLWFIKECFRALNEFGLKDDRAELEKRYRAAEEKLQQVSDVVSTNEPVTNKSKLAAYVIDGEHLDKTYNQVVSHLYVGPEYKAGLVSYQQATWSELEHEQHENEKSESKCVGLVIETRPDNISEAEVIRLRRLGCTKTQIGVQSLQDEVLKVNRRGHDVAATRRAFRLLRQAGFKIHAHWMANLHGSSVALDQKDYTELFADPDFKPDELKVYPCSLIQSAELMQYYQRGEWQPYTKEELIEVVGFALSHTPPYCRLTRVIRDIPSTDIVEGNKLTNFREIAQKDVLAAGEQLHDIRAREIGRLVFDPTQAKLTELRYDTSVSQEVFLQWVVPVEGVERLLGFLRLSLPTVPSYIDELKHAAIIREVHVYGQATPLGSSDPKAAQHQGYGTKLLDRAKQIVREHEFQKLAVISAVGTRGYYRQRGFVDGELYQMADLS